MTHDPWLMGWGTSLSQAGREADLPCSIHKSLPYDAQGRQPSRQRGRLALLGYAALRDNVIQTDFF